MEQQSQDSLRTKDATIALAYKPIIRGYFAVAAAYYGIMTLTHFWLLEGSSLALLASVSSIACPVREPSSSWLLRSLSSPRPPSWWSRATGRT